MQDGAALVVDEDSVILVACGIQKTGRRCRRRVPAAYNIVYGLSLGFEGKI